MKYIYLTFVVTLFCTTIGVNAKGQNISFKWNIQSEDYLKKALETEFKKLNQPDYVIQQISNCCVGKLKKAYPSGVNLTQEKFKYEIKQIGKICSDEGVSSYITDWSIGNDKLFMESIIRNLPSSLSYNTKLKLAECTLSKLKIKYPIGPKIDGEYRKEYLKVFESSLRDCITELKESVTGF